MSNNIGIKLDIRTVIDYMVVYIKSKIKDQI